MKIGIVCPYNIFKPGGVQQHISHQATILRKHGNKVTIITPRPRDHKQPAPRDVYFIGVSTRVRANSTWFDVSSNVETEEIEAMYKTLKLDIIHFHEPFIPLMPRQLAAAAPCPTIGTFHAALPENFVGRSIAAVAPYMRSVIRSVDTVTAVSPAAAAHILDLYDGQINFVPNGIDLLSYKQNNKLKRAPATILFVGRLEKRKGAKFLIDAFELVNQAMPEAKLIIAGDGPLRRSITNYARDRGIDKVEFLGYVDDEKKRELMSTCTIYCSPAIYGESFGIVLLEAMALGAPIVAHNNPGYESVLKDTGRLSLVNVKDTDEFSRRLILLMQDESLRKVWKTWATANIKQFSYENVVKAYEKLYSQLV